MTAINLDYMKINYSNASPPTTWYASTHSTDDGHNTGWTFTDPPAPPNGNNSSLITKAFEAGLI